MNQDTSILADPAVCASDTGRQLVVLCDGTNNTYNSGEGTNVLKLQELLGTDLQSSLVFYDPGVGSAAFAPENTLSGWFKRFRERVEGLAFGSGVYDNITEAYTFLMREYQPGDRIYVFGFSRGAFTARAVVGLVNAFGLLPQQSENLIPTLLNIYFKGTNDSVETAWEKLTTTVMRWEVAQGSRRVLSQKLKEHAVPLQRRSVTIHFVGVWDTVESIGMIPGLRESISAQPTLTNKNGTRKCFTHVRQALALDEYRLRFAPRMYDENDTEANEHGQSSQQRWYPGAHCDVGGTYGDNALISESAKHWLISEALGKGLKLSAPLPAAPSLSETRPVLHSELYDMPYWSIAGMAVRKSTYGHAAPDFSGIRYPQNTVWNKRRSLGAAVIAFGVCLLCSMLMAWAASGKLPTDIQQWWNVSSAFAEWSLHAWRGSEAMNPLLIHGHLKTAFFIDFFFIAAYGYLMGLMVTRSFASLAGLNSFNSSGVDSRARWLNRLGHGMTFLVIADIMEGSLALTYLSTLGELWAWLSGLLVILISLAACTKWLGLGMCVALILWAAGAAIRPRANETVKQ